MPKRRLMQATVFNTAWSGFSDKNIKAIEPAAQIHDEIAPIIKTEVTESPLRLLQVQ